MKIKNIQIEDYEEFGGMMVHGAIDGIIFSEYVKLVDGYALCERTDSNVKLNMKDEIEKVGYLDADEIIEQLENGAQEVFEDKYAGAYATALVELIPVYDANKDKKSPFPWCTYFFTSASATTLMDLKALATRKAKEDASGIAELLAEESEEADGYAKSEALAIAD